MGTTLILLSSICLSHGYYTPDSSWTSNAEEEERVFERSLTFEDFYFVPDNCTIESDDLRFFTAIQRCNQRQHEWYRL